MSEKHHILDFLFLVFFLRNLCVLCVRLFGIGIQNLNSNT